MSKYKHAVYYGTGFNDPTPRAVNHYEDDRYYGPIIEAIYQKIDTAHALRCGATDTHVENFRSRATIASYFQGMGFRVTQHIEDNTLLTIRWSDKEDVYR